jgi:serine/threonine protein kinase
MKPPPECSYGFRGCAPLADLVLSLLAPEVLMGEPYKKTIDYWSLGVVMYQFLVGSLPFEFDGDFAKLLHQIEER